MVFSSLIFLCGFLPIAILLYYLTPNRFRNLTLVGLSLIFYGWGDPLDIVIVAALVSANFFFGKSIDRAEHSRRLLLYVSVAGNLLVLIAFKYAEFLLVNLNVIGHFVSIPPLPVVSPYLPLGISFITFHIISYLVDVYRRTMPAQKSFIDFTLYICNFPQLIAGPIIRYHEIADQLENHRVTLRDFNAGITRFTAGLGKKLLIANPIGAISDTVFALPVSSYPTSFAWIAIVCYTLQIYFDFSAYSDMAIGLARMFGFRFPENFNYPYVSRSMQDFWRRWHMSLSRWFRDYLYIPLGGNRAGDLVTTRNLWIVFLLVGFWHGASWNFGIWGAWHGLFLSLERLPPVQRALGRMPAVLCHAYTLLIVMIGWVFFRSQDLPYAIDFIGRLFGGGRAPKIDVIVGSLVSPQMFALIAIASIFALPLWPAIARKLDTAFSATAMSLSRSAAIACILIVTYASMTIEAIPPFLYFRF
ncbi:MBOAT family O-acyltransferase [Tardiphaga sp. vice278]|uniref:MBOAT family O-acyltransferase n=1 Tax=Tardiphaga sp. vice278 TaxID=2592815 RepID=UPI001162A89C|nr:MBOAT family O-acyltransferase [Tardiphaga sp. vice278]QDM17978.1 MBOAT family protein [Tardiphaga sp. vice278]